MTAQPTNRLARETSPYLLQHRHNPVDWYPWGEEAFAAAREQDKPLFVSVGYSTCYWCHVMERQCFENEAIAAVMNRHFINVKVDREERPDVDQLYMTAVQVMTRQGGWPMNLWLLPDLRPFFGGTYFPPEDMGDRPSFPSICEGIAEAYGDRRADIAETAHKLSGVLKELAEPVAADENLTMDLPWIGRLLSRSVSDYDASNGGFGRAPKFPRQTLLALIIDWLEHNQAHPVKDIDVDEFRKPLRHALIAMAEGGIRDHLGGGFHRYSVDAAWMVPHFEIMLYDNAMLAGIYTRAAKLLDEPRFESVARGILNFILREMTSSQGPFFTAIDAEVDAREGGPYLWTLAEIDEVLTPRETSVFAQVYGLDRGPNFADPHAQRQTPTHNVLFLADPSRENDHEIAAMRDKLYAHRLSRKQPMLDTKIITSWNAMMIRAMADAGRLLGEPRYTDAANHAADFLLKHHRSADGGLARTSRDGVAKHSAFLDDYAFLADALLSLGRKDEAAEIVTAMVIRFYDHDKGGFYFSDLEARDLIVRQKIGSDSPLPAGNAIAAIACDAVGRHDEAAGAIKTFAMQANHHGESMSAHLQATLRHIIAHGPLTIHAQSEGQLAAAGYTPPDLKDVAQALVTIEPQLTGTAHALLTMTIADGHHITADSMKINAKAGTIGDINLPPPVRKRYEYADSEQQVYEGKFAIGVQLLTSPREGRPIEVDVVFGVCSDTACLPIVQREVWLQHTTAN